MLRPSSYLAFKLPGVQVTGSQPPFLPVSTSTAEGTLATQLAANTDNQLQLIIANYLFPVDDALKVVVGQGLIYQVFALTLNPFFDGSRRPGAIGIFGEANPIYTLVGAGTGGMLNYRLSLHYS